MMQKCNVACVQQINYTTRMSAALGSYLKTLRAHQGLTKAEVLRRLEQQLRLKVDRTTLWRAENGKAWPDGDILTGLLSIIGGTLEDLIWIQRNAEADAVEGVTLAESWLRQHGKTEHVATIMQARSRADATEIAEELEELAKRIRLGRE